MHNGGGAGKKLVGNKTESLGQAFFKGLQVEGSALVALRRARNTQAYNPSCRG